MSGAPDFKEGIFFGLDEDVYFAVDALSNSGIKSLRASPMLYWARSPMNPKPMKKDTEFMQLGKAYDCRILSGREAFYAKYAAALDPNDYAAALRTKDDIIERIQEMGGEFRKSAKKEELVAKLLDLDPDAEIWDDIVQEHREESGDRILLGSDLIARIEIAAKMIELDPELSKAFTGGYPQVSIFWRCAETGVPMKARLDYLKTRAIVDLKTASRAIGNTVYPPIPEIIGRAIMSAKSA